MTYPDVDIPELRGPETGDPNLLPWYSRAYPPKARLSVAGILVLNRPAASQLIGVDWRHLDLIRAFRDHGPLYVVPHMPSPTLIQLCLSPPARCDAYARPVKLAPNDPLNPMSFTLSLRHLCTTYDIPRGAILEHGVKSMLLEVPYYYYADPDRYYHALTVQLPDDMAARAWRDTPSPIVYPDDDDTYPPTFPA